METNYLFIFSFTLNSTKLAFPLMFFFKFLPHTLLLRIKFGQKKMKEKMSKPPDKYLQLSKKFQKMNSLSSSYSVEQRRLINNNKSRKTSNCRNHNFPFDKNRNNRRRTKQKNIDTEPHCGICLRSPTSTRQKTILATTNPFVYIDTA